MVLKVPHITMPGQVAPLSLCRRLLNYSLLGFGDILVPGLVVSYCHGFDLITGTTRRIYYVTSAVSYGLGLIATFIALYLMAGSAQPALLYLVPFTLIPPTVIAI